MICININVTKENVYKANLKEIQFVRQTRKGKKKLAKIRAGLVRIELVQTLEK